MFRKTVNPETVTPMRLSLQKKIIIVSVIILLIIIVMIFQIISGTKKNEITINSTATKNYAPESTGHMKLETDATGIQVPVPIGYVGSKATGENTINTGYVIYEGEEEVNNTNLEESKRTRNQYVWVPVPDASKLYGRDENGKLWGKGYSFTTGTGTDVDKITGARPLNWSETNGIMTILAKTSYREPDVVPKTRYYINDTDSGLKTFNIGEEVTHEYLFQLENEFNEMIESVEKYGGFYIGRYETGDLAKPKAVIKKGNSNFGGQPGYVMYRKCKELKGDNNNVETGVIWGCQYDRTLMWLIESGNKTKKQIAEDSKDWGNYYNVAVKYIDNDGVEKEKPIDTNSDIPSGTSETTKANNIYDLAGNILDWTFEANFNSDRIWRGGMCGNPGTKNVSSRDSVDANYKISGRGCRAGLYIKP